MFDLFIVIGKRIPDCKCANAEKLLLIDLMETGIQLASSYH